MPNSVNDWTTKATKEDQPWQEQACAVCAVKGWLENQAEVYIFRGATGTTTWKKQFYAACGDDDDECEDEDDGKQPEASDGRHSAPGALLVAGGGKFCLAPKGKVHKLLDVHRYEKR